MIKREKASWENESMRIWEIEKFRKWNKEKSKTWERMKKWGNKYKKRRKMWKLENEEIRKWEIKKWGKKEWDNKTMSKWDNVNIWKKIRKLKN